MKGLFFLLIAGFCLNAGCSTSGKFYPGTPIQPLPYIIVYGRENCSACTTFSRKLSDSKIRYTYSDMSNESVRTEVHARMKKAGLNTKKFQAPVVDVNGSLAIRPNLHAVLERYNPLPRERPGGVA